MNENLPARQQPAGPIKVDLTKPLADLDEAIRVAETLARSELVPRALYGKPANILHVLITGQEMGLKWPVSLRVIYSPGQGQIGIRGQFLLAKLREAGHDYSWKDGEDYCEFTLIRDGMTDKPGHSYSATFSLDDAVQAGLARRLEDGRIVSMSRENKPLPWMQYTSRMLFWRAVSDCVGRAAPEVMLGFEIQGAEPPQEPGPEVMLTPQEPGGPAAPGESAHGMAAPDEAGKAAELRELDRRMQQNAGVADAPPAGSPHESGSYIDPDMAEDLDAETRPDPTQPAPGTGQASVDPRSAVPVSPAAGDLTSPASSPDDGELDERPAETPGRAAAKAKSQILAEHFGRLGWEPRKYRPNVLGACSMFLRRRVGGVREMTAGEMMLLTERLMKIARDNEEEHYTVALADAVEGWRQDWEREDIASYERFTGEGA